LHPYCIFQYQILSGSTALCVAIFRFVLCDNPLVSDSALRPPVNFRKGSREGILRNPNCNCNSNRNRNRNQKPKAKQIQMQSNWAIPLPVFVFFFIICIIQGLSQTFLWRDFDRTVWGIPRIFVSKEGNRLWLCNWRHGIENYWSVFVSLDLIMAIESDKIMCNLIFRVHKYFQLIKAFLVLDFSLILILSLNITH